MYKIKSGNKGIMVRLTITKPDGTPFNLSGASVTFVMANGVNKVSKSCTVESASGGICYCTLDDTDTSAPGVYSVEAKISVGNNLYSTVTDAKIQVVKSL